LGRDINFDNLVFEDLVFRHAASGNLAEGKIDYVFYGRGD
jgi:hypothetical protein